jgi:uncharacterized protein YjbI with pentapeptide repeats
LEGLRELAVKFKIDTSGLDLSYVSMRDADLTGMSLQEVVFLYASLVRVNLSGADLYGANLRHANLWKTRFWNAELPKADLRYANLEQTDFRGALLQGADFRWAKVDRVKWEGAQYDNSTRFPYPQPLFKPQREGMIYNPSPILRNAEKG